MSDLIFNLEEADIEVGGKLLFENLSFPIKRGSKIALVGNNGSGKTTLMNVINGQKDVMAGLRWLYPNISITTMRQELLPDSEHQVEDLLFQGMVLEDWEREYKIASFLTPLGLTAETIIKNLSGGQKRKLELARALLAEPDILLLDEPTNHVDLEVIEWLEQTLRLAPYAIIVVSHDRQFLKNFTNKVFWLDRGKLKICPKGFAYFDEWAKDLLAQEGRALHNRQSKILLELNWAKGGVKARVKRNERRKALAFAAADQYEKDLASYKRATRKIQHPPIEILDKGDNIVEFIHSYKSFWHTTSRNHTNKATTNQPTEIKILTDFNLKIKKGERIGLIGKNGTGKSCLLKLMLGHLTPDQGKVKLAKNLNISYFDQNRSELNETATVQHNLCALGNDHLWVRGKWRHVCGYIKDFLFQAEDAFRPVATLSGGQKNRLLLAKILANPGEVLLLDEPTNDLDMDTLDLLTDILESYQGTLIVVSHDLDFLSVVCDKLLIFEGDARIESYWGDYEDYIANKIPAKAIAQKTSTNIITKPITQESGKKNTNKLSYKEQWDYDNLPKTIADLEKNIAELVATLNDPELYQQDKEQFFVKSQLLEQHKLNLINQETRWLELAEKISN